MRKNIQPVILILIFIASIVFIQGCNMFSPTERQKLKKETEISHYKQKIYKIIKSNWVLSSDEIKPDENLEAIIVPESVA